jgi:hypothetical protein
VRGFSELGCVVRLGWAGGDGASVGQALTAFCVALHCGCCIVSFVLVVVVWYGTSGVVV